MGRQRVWMASWGRCSSLGRPLSIAFHPSLLPFGWRRLSPGTGQSNFLCQFTIRAVNLTDNYHSISLLSVPRMVFIKIISVWSHVVKFCAWTKVASMAVMTRIIRCEPSCKDKGVPSIPVHVLHWPSQGLQLDELWHIVGNPSTMLPSTQGSFDHHTNIAQSIHSSHSCLW